MGTVTEDVISGSSVNQDKDGWKAIRTFVVEGVEGDSHQRLYNALLEGGIPTRGDDHPSIGGIRVDSRQATPEGRGVVRITINYQRLDSGTEPPSPSEPAQITVGSSVQEKETAFDFRGDQLVVPYTYESGVDGDGNPITETVFQPGNVTVQVPATILALSRKEDQDPLTKSREFVGTINVASWRGGAPGTWLCTRIEGQSSTGGEDYVVQYEFMYNPDTWDAVIVYKDPETGLPGSEVNKEEGNGYTTAVVYPEQNFDELNI